MTDTTTAESEGSSDSGLECADEEVACDGRCIDPQSDTAYCGASADCLGDNAGDACVTGGVCDAGACGCTDGLVECDGRCTEQPSDAAVFGYTGNLVDFVVPACVYRITFDVSGGQGGGLPALGGGGLGAQIEGSFDVTPGEELTIVVGQQGLLTTGGQPQVSSGGGGGSFVYSDDALLIAAGGGGGRCNYNSAVPLHAEAAGQSGEAGGIDSSAQYPGGVDGEGGVPGDWNARQSASGGGAGWVSPGGGGLAGGQNASSGWSGGIGLCHFNPDECGGYGGHGGGGGGGTLFGGGGGGGGYSGGGGGGDPDHGGGGGSYNSGDDQTNVEGAQFGNGSVLVLW